MNIKPRTTVFVIAAIVGIIILGQVTKHDSVPMTVQQQAADKIYQHKRFHEQWCQEHNTCAAEQDVKGELADSVVRATK